ncbi:RnfH family protein [Aliikangiella sp. IMCC44359]|uniref:RnfH family protein n=1 Tax=Aliikangiella sp. IMCC44359 TaxID=3459125 RepID=UPI00403B1C8E
MAELITVELIYPLPTEQELITIKVKTGCQVKQAIVASGILDKYPDIDLAKNKVGIFSKVCKLNETLREGDRIEIYRPLIADPKEARKKKASLQKEKINKN